MLSPTIHVSTPSLAHRCASSSRMWERVRGMKIKPAMAARPVATTTEIQLIVPLDTVSQVLFLLPVWREGLERRAAE